MSPDQQSVIESSVLTFETQFHKFKEGRIPKLSQVMSGSNLTYMYLDDETQDCDEVYERCKERMTIYIGLFSVTRWASMNNPVSWRQETHEEREVVLRVFGSTYEEMLEMALAALAQEPIKHPATSALG